METKTIQPTEGQIKQTIQTLKNRLYDSEMNKPVNRAVKEGYTEALNILVEDRRTYDGIDRLTTIQGRAIAVMAVDYLNGEFASRVLTEVPLKP